MNNYYDLIEKIIPTLTFKFPYSAKEYNNNMFIENYHKHSDFSNTSTADSGDSMKLYVDRIKELGSKCLFTGEHGTQGNQFENYTLAEQNKLKYIHSTEAYWVKNRLENDRTNCHMMLLAKNKKGREDINYVLSMANIDGYYYKPRIDLKLLFDIPKDNVIVTSACIAGWKYENAEQIWLDVYKHFGNNFFLEVQTHNTKEQIELNKKILRISQQYGIEMIVGLDSHYIKPENAVKRDKVLEYKKISYPEENGWYMDYCDSETVINRLKQQGIFTDEQIIRMIMNTNIFASDDVKEIKLDKKFKIPSLFKTKSLAEKADIYMDLLKTLYDREKYKSKEKWEGIEYEANEVIQSNVQDYFLTSRAIIQKAIKDYGGILTTTGRGSACSFITNKLLGFTTVDRYKSEVPMYPERFLTKERVLAGQMPDIDSNIVSQEPFIKATKDLFGEHSCYPLYAIEYIKVKSGWQMYASLNGVSPSEANDVSKCIEEYGKVLKHTDDEDKDSIKIEDFISQEYIDIFNKSADFRNIIINGKAHPCGFLIFDGDIRREIGLISAISENTGKRTVCANVEGKWLDSFGYVKEDFLIVDTVSLTNKCFKKIGKPVPTFEELKELVKNDKKTWEIYEKGITCCVNQVEKSSTTNRAKHYKPKNYLELAMFIAGIRPGFASLIDNFLNRLPYTTGEKSIDSILKDTYHYMIYQESVMKVLGYLGLEMSDTYNVIKSISKKKYIEHPEKLKELQDILIKGWEEKIGSIDNFEKVWKVIEQNSRYSFNASHAACMAGDSLYIAYFKAHYPKEFYEVAITHYQEKGDKKKVTALLIEAKLFYGYELGGYCFRDDNRQINIKDNVIYPNLSSIKSIGEKVANELYDLKDNPYDSFLALDKDIINKTSVNKTQVETLIKLNFFKEFGEANFLLKQHEIYTSLPKTQFNKDKLANYGLTEDVVRKFSRKETNKQFGDVDKIGLINNLILNVNKRSVLDILKDEKNFLSTCTYTNKQLPDYLYFVYELKLYTDKAKPYLLLYKVKDGTILKTKITKRQLFMEQPFSEDCFISIKKIRLANKTKKVGNEWIQLEEKEQIIDDYVVL